MVAPIAAVGSMMVRGVFKSGGLLTGLGSMVGKLKGAQMEGKSTSTEMKRMTGHAHLLRNALAMIGVGGFSALLMQTPALAGALVKIKTEMQLMANIVGRALKPSLDAVATILQGIRTGDWNKVKAGVIDLVTEVGILALAVGGIVVDFIWGEGTSTKMLEALKKWAEDLQTAWDDNDFGQFLITLVFTPLKWVWDTLIDFFGNLRNEVDRIIAETADSIVTEGVGETLRQMPVVGKLMAFAGYDRAWEQKQEKIMAQGGPSGKAGWIWDQKPSIEKQENTFNIDMKGITGDIEDPGVLQKIYDAVTAALRDEQRSVTV